MSYPTFDNPKKLRQEIDAYFALCSSSRVTQELKNGDIKIRQRYPTISGLALYLGCCRDTINSYVRGEDKRQLDADTQEQISDTLRYAMEYMADLYQQAGLSGDAESKIVLSILSSMGVLTPSDTGSAITIKIEGFQGDYTV